MKTSSLFTSLVAGAGAFNFGRGSTRMLAMAASDHATFVSESIQENEVMIFSKSYCPFCNKAKAAFDELGISYGAIELVSSFI
jgi:hypothetical protein